MSKTKLVLGVVAVAAVVGGLKVLGYIGGPDKEADGQKFSIETTPLGRLLDTPCTRQLFLTKFGAEAMVKSPQIAIAQHLTMRRLAAFPLARLNDQKLKAIQAEFANLDPNSPECKRTGGV